MSRDQALNSKILGGSGIWSRTPTVSLHEPPHGPCDLLIPQRVDKRVAHGGDNCVEEGKNLVCVPKRICLRPHIGNSPSPKKEYDHKQVRGAGGEDLLTPLGRGNAKDSGKNTGIRGHNQREGREDKGDCDKEIPHFAPESARSSQSQHRQDVTQEVMNGVGAAERQSEDEDRVSGASDDARKVRDSHHAGARSLVHQGGIMQWTADRSISVISHGGEQTAFGNAEKGKEVQLREAAATGDGGAGRAQVSQHPRHDGSGVEDLHQGEVTQEEVHGGVER